MEKPCQSCKKEFGVRKEDLVFYEQIKVPPPNFCPDCRMMRRLAFRNERTLYKRPCDLCKQDGVSLYPAGTPFPVYCQKCWWGDGWDPTAYAMDWDKSRPFYDQFRELKNKIPRIGLLVIDCVNCDYTNNTGECKNCYLIFAAETNEDCMYGRLIQRCKNSMDCAFLYDSELCYECVDTRKSFKCMYSERLLECVDVMFSFDMRNSQNCIFCVNGRNLNYCIENVQYSKEEYEKKKAEILSSYESIEEAKRKYNDLRSKALVKYAVATKCNDATGDYMYNCHEGVNIFDASNTKNSSYVADAEDALDCQDCNNLYFKPERLYNIMGTLQSTNCIAGVYIMYGNEVHYSDSCYNCVSCFGCVGLNKKNYHILNKEYSKEEYQKIKSEIVEQLKKDGLYGDFFPPELSPFGYNESLAQEYYPLSEKEAGERGFNWQKQTSGTYGKETLKENEIPATLGEATEDILNQILVCKDCKKNFRITRGELDFYKRMNLPLPHKDFECRHQDRMKKRNPRQLWPRSCMCTLKNHQHKDKNCENIFETSYSPNRPETVYCEPCYQQEVS
ncbi:MAG: hypothetical protein WCT29_02965 [Candidatus Paceibacterota bacterium]|jgi:hypothetical protein